MENTFQVNSLNSVWNSLFVRPYSIIPTTRGLEGMINLLWIETNLILIPNMENTL
jgi:hypothetical protein